MAEIDFSVPPGDLELIEQIANRAIQTLPLTEVKRLVMMDLCCVHNRTPLRLAELLEADNFNFAHDLSGICRHLNRTTGELENCFVPRFACN